MIESQRDSSTQDAADRPGPEGATAVPARTVTPVQDDERRWLHPAWKANLGVALSITDRFLRKHEANSAWAARIGVARSTLGRIVESVKGPQLGDFACLPVEVLIDVLDAWRSELLRTSVSHLSVHELAARASKEFGEAIAAALRRGDKSEAVREIREAIRELQALQARVEASS